ncbi:MAG: ROK family protein [Eubacteriales bacterium]
MGMKKVLAIDIGGTSVKYAHISQTGEVSNKSSYHTATIATLEEFLEQLRKVVVESVEQGITQIGISSLGLFHEQGMCLGGVENLAYLNGVNLVDQIHRWYPEIEVRIMNDGTAAAMGEYWLGEAKGCNHFICITLGTGIGSAIVINGQPLLGSNYRSGEIGYTNYQTESDYFELQYSTKGVLDRAAKVLQVEAIDGLQFVEYVKKGDPDCVRLFTEWMEALGGMIANTILVLDPEKIIIGGGISGQKEWLCEALYEEVQRKLPPDFRGKNNVVPAKNGNDAGLLGAVASYYRS